MNCNGNCKQGRMCDCEPAFYDEDGEPGYGLSWSDWAGILLAAAGAFIAAGVMLALALAL